MKKFSKVAGYKISIQNQLFLYTNLKKNFKQSHLQQQKNNKIIRNKYNKGG